MIPALVILTGKGDMASDSQVRLHLLLRKRKVLLLGEGITDERIKRPFSWLITENGDWEFSRDTRSSCADVVVEHARVDRAVQQDCNWFPEFDVIFLAQFECDAVQQRELTTLLPSMAMFYEKSRKDPVPTPLPQLILIRFDKHRRRHGIDMARYVSGSKFFVKEVNAGTRNWGTVLVSCVEAALKESVCHSLSLTYPAGIAVLERWLQNFEEGDHLSLLLLCRYVRFYSLDRIVHVLDKYIESTSQINQHSKQVCLLGGPNLRPYEYVFSYLGRPNKSAPGLVSLLGKMPWLQKLNTALKGGTAKPVKRQPKTITYDDLAEVVVSTVLGCKKHDNPELVVILLDDVIGSGGQIMSYLHKFFNRDLRDFVERLFPKPHFSAVWRTVASGLVGSRPQVRFKALFVVGISPKRGTSGLPLEHVEVKDVENWRSLVGKTKVAIESISGAAIDVEVHIADYTKSLWELITEGTVDGEIQSILEKEKYRWITRSREKEHPLQFEPFGWKEGGGLVATYANCPGNTLSIFWADGAAREWVPLFQRFFSPWDDGRGKETNILKICKKALEDLRVDSSEKNMLLAYVLRKRTTLDDSDIVKQLDDPNMNVNAICEETEHRLQKDKEFYNRVRLAFVKSCDSGNR